jgi:hypothetical protein
MVKMIRHKGRVLVALLALCGIMPSAAGDEAVRFGSGSLSLLQAGQSYVYSLRLLMKGPYGYGPDHYPLARDADELYQTRHIRVLVTDVVRADSATRVKARVDKLDADGRVLYAGVYFLLLASEDQKTRLVIKDDFHGGGNASFGGTFQEIPSVFAGLPPMTSVEREGAASLTHTLAGHIPTRYVAQYDAKESHVILTVEYFRDAYEDEPAKGHRILYWVKDKEELLPVVPVGEEPAPMLEPKVGFPRDRFGDPARYNVRPVTLDESETQVWEPGAPFPTKITRTRAQRAMLFEATLVKVEQVPVEAPAAEPAPAGATAAPAQ